MYCLVNYEEHITLSSISAKNFKLILNTKKQSNKTTLNYILKTDSFNSSLKKKNYLTQLEEKQQRNFAKLKETKEIEKPNVMLYDS